MDKIIKESPNGEDRFCIEYSKDFNTFKFNDNPYHQEKAEIFRTIFAVEKKLSTLMNKMMKKRNFEI